MIGLILVLIVLAVILYAFDQLVPTTESNKPIKILIWVVVVVCVIYYLAALFGVADIPLPRRVG